MIKVANYIILVKLAKGSYRVFGMDVAVVGVTAVELFSKQNSETA